MNTQTELDRWQDELEATLPRDASGPMLVRVYRETRSTQDIAKTFAPRKALVLADQQTAGRGRLGRSWLSTPGACVLMSMAWPSAGTSATHDRVSMLSGVAVARAVEHLVPGTAVRLKWPNDVMIDGRKLAGILIEAVRGAYVIGIGLNVQSAKSLNEQVKTPVTSLAEHGPSIDRLRVIQTIVAELDRTLRSTDQPQVLDAWRSRAALGQTQTFEHHGQRVTGQVLDLDPDHGLIVRRDTGEIITLPAATTSVVA